MTIPGQFSVTFNSLEANWIPTSGKAPYAMFRFYGPEDRIYDKSFKLADIQKAN